MHGYKWQINCTRTRTAGTEVGAKSVMPHESLPVMDMVAELMILANSAVAKQIYTAFPSAGTLHHARLRFTYKYDARMSDDWAHWRDGRYKAG